MEIENDEKNAKEEKREIEEKQKIYKLLGLIMEVGLTMVLSVLVFVFLGYWIDKTYNYKPIFTLLGIGVGVAGGFYNVYRVFKRID